jgi:hypothetical protein
LSGAVVLERDKHRERDSQTKRERAREREARFATRSLSHDVWWQFVTEKEERESELGGEVVLRRFLLFAIFSGISTFFFVQVLFCCAKFVASRCAKDVVVLGGLVQRILPTLKSQKKKTERERVIRALEEIEQYAVVCWRLAAGVHVSSTSYLHRRSSSCSR